ncbi:hypothetical protein Taro_024782 [Colocasia esculenta]|uniref:Uncharacterized protein n=1 Tax=Colocasia esculenta TaxID=4460 RepID=A0A843VEM1_COLES|nr:hypothetical protein [Colocasia esculenta]
MEHDRVLYGLRQGCQNRRPERNVGYCRVQNATSRGVATGFRIRRHIGQSRSGGLRLTLTGVRPDIGLRTRTFKF